MYEDFYGLNADPFRLSSDHRFCFPHRSYARAKAYVQYALHRAEGFVMITGRPGTGKTTLINDLLESLPDKEVVVGTLVSTQLEAEDLLLMTGHAFGLDFPSMQKALILQRIMDFLNQQHRQGLRTLLIIDEAQDLSSSALEELRLLTNLQRNGQPVLQIALLGQEALRDLVRGPQMEQIHQRLIAAWQLEPLSPEETIGYVRHRLERAGWRGNPSFQPGVLPLIYDFSQGVPRRINLICSRLLLHGFIGGHDTLTEADAETVMADLHREELALPDSEWEARSEEDDRDSVPARRRTLREGVWLEIDQGIFWGETSGGRGSAVPPPQPGGGEGHVDSGSPARDPALLEPQESVRPPPAREPDVPSADSWVPARASDPPVSAPSSRSPRGAEMAVPDARLATRHRPFRHRRSHRTRWWLLLLLTALVLAALFLSRPFIQGASLSAISPRLEPVDQAWTQYADTAWDAIQLVQGGIVVRVQPPAPARFPETASGVPTAPPREPTPPLEGSPAPGPAPAPREGPQVEGSATSEPGRAAALDAESPAGLPSEVAPAPAPVPRERPQVEGSAPSEPGGDAVPALESSPGLPSEVAIPTDPPPPGLGAQTDVPGLSEQPPAGSSEGPGVASPPAALSGADVRDSGPVTGPAAGPPAPLLKAEVRFRISSTVVDSSYNGVLDDVVRLLEQTDGAFAEVVGYTDATGPVEYNENLARRRARSVADRIIVRGGAPDRLKVRGHDPRENATGRGEGSDGGQTRRVEVTVWRGMASDP